MLKIFIFALLSYQAYSNVTIIIPDIQEYSNPESPGFINELSQKTNLAKDSTIIYAPLKRALYKYTKEKKDCFIGGDKKITRLYAPHLNLDEVLNSKPFLAVRSKIFTREKIICDPQELKGMNVLIHSGYPLQNFIKLDQLQSYKQMNNRLNALKMVREERADAFVGFVPPNDKHFAGLKFCPDKNLTMHYETIQCHKTPETEKFIQRINKEIETLYNNGDLKKMIKKWFPKRFDQFMDQKLFK